jgi:hypothetical protein
MVLTRIDEEMAGHYQAVHAPKRSELERVKAELNLPF